MMRLDVSESPPSPDVDTLPHASISEDDGSTSQRGPPSEASSDWERVTDHGSLTPPTE